jgi:hypothetical protein
MVAIFPQGRNLIDATAVEGERPEDFLRRVFGNDYARLLAAFFRFGARFPSGVEEWHSVDREAGVVHCVDVFRNLDLFPDLKEVVRPVILPPLVVAASEAGYPVQLPADFKARLRVPGPEGPFFLGEASSHIVSYTLPLPPLTERALPWVDGGEEWKALLRECVEEARAFNERSGDLLGRVAAGRRQGRQAYSFLDSGSRGSLDAADARALAAFAEPTAWTKIIEPSTGLAFQSGFSTEGPLFERYNHDLGNGLILDALYHYVKYSGDWDWAKANAPLLRERLLNYFIVADDWGWMRPGTTLRGSSTGSGENMNATLAGLRAAALLLDEAGDPESADLAYYLLARAAVPTVQRFKLAEYAERNNLLPEGETILGFREGEGFVRADFRIEPAQALSNFSAQGPHPAIFDLLMPYAEVEIHAQTEAFAKAWPRWFRGEAGSGPTSGGGEIALPMIYARERLGEEPPIVEQYLRHSRNASQSRSNWWMAPPVLAEYLSGGRGIWVEDWGRLRFVGASLDGDRLHVDLEALPNAIGKTNRISVHVPVAPTAAYFNFQKESVAGYEPDKSRIVFLWTPQSAGPAALTLDWSDLPAPSPSISRFVSVSQWTSGGAASSLSATNLAQPAWESPAPASIDFSAESSSLAWERKRRAEQEAAAAEAVTETAADETSSENWDAPVFIDEP